MLRKYLNNECSAEEASLVLDWINSENNRDEVIDDLEHDWLEFNDETQLSPNNFERIRHHINRSIKINRISQKKFLLGAAASLLLLISVTLYFYKPVSALHEGFSEVTTLKGERKTIILSDGSSILLDADSKVIYPKHLTKDNREVFLEGQAFFRMTSSKPLKINSNNLTTIARATSFSVSAFPDMDKIIVAIKEGIAEVHTGEEKIMPLLKLRFPKGGTHTREILPTVVKEREYLAYNKQGDTLEKETYHNEKQVFGWKEGIIYFKEANSREISSTLERWYGVDICFDKETETLFSGEFSNQKVEEIVKAIGNTSQMEFKIGPNCKNI